MTISSETAKTQYDGNDATTSFNTGFYFIIDADVKVVLTDSSEVDTVQVNPTNYTLLGAGDLSGGSVEMVTPPATGERITIVRDVSLDQSTDYISGDNFPAETHEQALDRLTMQVQELSDKVDRCVKAPVSEPLLPSAFDGVFTDLAARADKYLSFDSDGDISVSDTSSSTTITTDTNSITFSNGECFFKIECDSASKQFKMYGGYSLVSLTLFQQIAIP